LTAHGEWGRYGSAMSGLYGPPRRKVGWPVAFCGEEVSMDKRAWPALWAAIMILGLGIRISQGTELRIGASVSQTGPFATEVGPFGALLKAWADELNAVGGILTGGKRIPVRMFLYDDRSDEATARRMYERMATVDQVHLMLGPYSSPLTFAASTAAELHKVPFLAICANSPKIYERGYRWIACVIDEAPRYTYRYWEMIRHEGLARSVSFVVEDTLHPKGVYEGARALAQEAGLRVLSSQIAPRDTRDFTTLLVRLKEEDPDILFVSANIPFAIQFMAQARDQRLRPREFHVTHHGGPFLKALGTAAEGVTGQSYWTRAMRGPGADRFLKLLEAARISPDDYPWAPAYMMALQVVEAVLAGAPPLDRASLMEHLKASRTETLGGEVWFRENGVGSINTYPSQIQGGSYQIVWPPELATAPHIYPATKDGNRK
jgi:branched-chain amino acid transport system substrate-binding protein